MELKSELGGLNLSWNNSSNRTFMELKSFLSFISSVTLTCSNRTFMELKSMSNSGETLAQGVLIAPLWN